MLSVVLGASTTIAAEPTAEQLTFFEQQVRPLLVKRCYECHSQESASSEGGLLLDSRIGWENGGDSGSAIEPGNVAGSLLITAIRYDGLEMPPEGKLPAREIAIFEKWVEMGAPDPRIEPLGGTAGPAKTIDWEAARQFWSFKLPQHHDAPVVELAGWPHDDIDRFVLNRIEAAGLTPTVDADRRTWLRRVTFDLTGLPPTPDEVAAFLTDTSDGATARVVDRLLGSPAFGEHWGRHWLDVARYADTNGGDFNATFKSAWRYRDYVIDAFNNDKPFDLFIREQLAGDLLPHDDNEQRAEQLIATGFLMIGCKMLSERDKAKFRMDVVDEQIDTVGRAFLGLTLGCARCHDHKFDPLPTADYYSLAGIFQSTETYRGESQKYVSTWKEVDLPVDEALAVELNAHKQQSELLRADIERLVRDRASVAAELGKIDAHFARRWEAATTPEQQSRLFASATAFGKLLIDNSDATVVGDWTLSTHRPAFVGDGYLHNSKQGLGEKRVEYRPQLRVAGRYEVRMSFPGSDGLATNVPVVVVHAEGETRITVDQSKTPTIDKLWVSLGEFAFQDGDKSSVTIRTDDTDSYVIADAIEFIPVDDSVIAGLAETTDPHVADFQNQLTRLTEQIEMSEQELANHKQQKPTPPTCMAVREHAQIGDAAIRIRGEVHREGDFVPRGFLTILSGDERRVLSDTSQSGRLELADWIASRDNPLTSRVIVNRVWQHLFGRGIVPSVDNFGELGERPTHPELLDTLAVDFADDGWSLKRLIRRIALSHTYGLSTNAGSDVSESGDPTNALLSHFRRRRLPAESLRDAMLSISGRLDREPGGSSVEPLEYLAIATSGKKSADLKVDENARRSVFLPMVRNDLPEFLLLFDMADPELVTGRRPVTNVPAQALFLMNSPFVSLTADQTASRVMSETNDQDERLTFTYRLLLSRPPTDSERRRALDFLARETSTPNAQTWSQFIHILLASTEFRMLD